MLLINYIRENKEEVITKLKIKNFEATDIINQIILIDIDRRNIQKQLDDVLSEMNKISKDIGALFQSGETAKANELKNKTTELKQSSKLFNDILIEKETNLNKLLVQLPNIPHHSIPPGKSAEDNLTIYQHGIIPELSKGSLAHWDLATKYNLIDFELGNKITGAGFPVYIDKGAKLQRALINFFLNKAVENGYTEIQPPVLINESSAYGTGQLPDKDSQMYYVSADNFYLTPTAEVPLTNIYRDKILKFSELPVKNTAYTLCFRREAGSYGKDVRGLNRLHQFDKIEIVQIVNPENSYNVLEDMKDYVAMLLKELNLPFRVLKLCGGDLSFTSAFTYDMEVYSAGQQKWLEVSSISNFETFQSNRMKIRFKDNDNKTRLVHTLNGSALALPRIMAAILENNQTANEINIPEVLVPYTGFSTIK